MEKAASHFGEVNNAMCLINQNAKEAQFSPTRGGEPRHRKAAVGVTDRSS